MSKIDDARAVLQGLSGKQLTDQQMIKIAEKFAAANNFKNPWNPNTNPAEHAAWPTNLETATFFLDKLLQIVKNNIFTKAEADFKQMSAADYASLEAQRIALRNQYVEDL